MTFESLLWSLATGVHDGQPLVVRFRQITEVFDKSRYPTRLNIFWKMSELTSTGLPSHNDEVLLETFEDRLVNAVEHDKSSILSVVLTCGGQREFVFHTRDQEDFLRRLSSMPQERERYPLNIQQYEDPEWKYDASVTGSFVATRLQ